MKMPARRISDGRVLFSARIRKAAPPTLNGDGGAAVRYASGTTISLMVNSLPCRSQVWSLPQWGQILPCGTVG